MLPLATRDHRTHNLCSPSRARVFDFRPGESTPDLDCLNDVTHIAPSLKHFPGRDEGPSQVIVPTIVKSAVRDLDLVTNDSSSVGSEGRDFGLVAKDLNVIRSVLIHKSNRGRSNPEYVLGEHDVKTHLVEIQDGDSEIGSQRSVEMPTPLREYESPGSDRLPSKGLPETPTMQVSSDWVEYGSSGDDRGCEVGRTAVLKRVSSYLHDSTTKHFAEESEMLSALPALRADSHTMHDEIAVSVGTPPREPLFLIDPAMHEPDEENGGQSLESSIAVERPGKRRNSASSHSSRDCSMKEPTSLSTDQALARFNSRKTNANSSRARAPVAKRVASLSSSTRSSNGNARSTSTMTQLGGIAGLAAATRTVGGGGVSRRSSSLSILSVRHFEHDDPPVPSCRWGPVCPVPKRPRWKLKVDDDSDDEVVLSDETTKDC